MKEEEINIAIETALGFSIPDELGIEYKDGEKSFGNSDSYTRSKCANYQRQGLRCKLITRKSPYGIRDYFNNLNAMHEAEKALAGAELTIYRDRLLDLTIERDWQNVPITATAAQRAEAFLRTIGKWEDEA